MKVRVFESPRAVARALALDIARSLRRTPRLVLGLPTGRTPVPLYRELVSLYRKRRIDFSRATTFNLDEFLGLSAEQPRSYRASMERQLFDRINLPSTQIHFLDGTAADVDVECAEYEGAIERAGGIDLQILGIGVNGHIGFNEPGRVLVASTHRVRLSAATRRANASFFGGRADRVPREALSMGMATILRAGRIVLVATGRAKASCIGRMINGPITTRVPASFLQLHANVEVWVDRAAAAVVEAV